MARAHTHPKYKALFTAMQAEAERLQARWQEAEADIRRQRQRYEAQLASAKSQCDWAHQQRRELQRTMTELQAIVAGYASTELIPAMEANAFYHPTRARHELSKRQWLMLHCWFRGRNTYEQPVGLETMTWRGAPVIVAGTVPDEHVVQADGPPPYQEGR